MLWRLLFWLTDTLRVQARTHKKILLWLTFCLVVGIAAGITAIVISGIGADDINYHLVDANIRNMASISANFGGFIWQRLLTLLWPVVLLFVLALLWRGFTVLIFPIIVMQGYWLCVSVWWTICYYTVNAVFLLAFYLIWLLLVSAILMVATLWAIKMAQNIRQCNYHMRGHWRPLWRGLVVICAVGVVLGTLEFLVFTCFLGRIVYKPL